jgi:hypothetical protein
MVLPETSNSKSVDLIEIVPVDSLIIVVTAAENATFMK